VLALIAMVVGACAVALAISGQSGATRSAYAGVVLGRTATELADSALAECVAELSGVLSAPPGTDVRARLKAAAQGDRVAGADVAGQGVYTYEPTRTRALIAADHLPCELAAVRVTPRFYLLAENRGELEVEARCTCHVSGRRTLVETVREWHAFSIESDARTFEVIALPGRRALGREGAE